ncbi:BlaI/MecI/CopY family transcriptional regulator [Granulicella arctica]|uniref:BlaI/MecI/CopY family transcriptional regulator n=1 Tax=Granulicella arctica TaxID=940613 RepID=UPI0021DFB41B|nr:BlaI/MecI/CopY family transcriptional regulator [Granulicella arctica]
MKRRKANEQIPPMELSIMNVLWDNGPCSVQEVQTKLSGESAYTTVQTTLNTMEKKGRTKRDLQGRAYVYEAALSREAAMKTAVRDLVDRMFSGSVESLMMNLVKAEEVDEATFKRLRKVIADRSQR